MSCYEVDGKGNVKVWTFVVTDGENDWHHAFTDYAEGCDWARQVERDIHDYCADDDVEVRWDCDYEWIPDDEVSEYKEHVNARED